MVLQAHGIRSPCRRQATVSVRDCGQGRAAQARCSARRRLPRSGAVAENRAVDSRPPPVARRRCRSYGQGPGRLPASSGTGRLAAGPPSRPRAFSVSGPLPVTAATQSARFRAAFASRIQDQPAGVAGKRPRSERQPIRRHAAGRAALAAGIARIRLPEARSLPHRLVGHWRRRSANAASASARLRRRLRACAASRPRRSRRGEPASP